ncbi:SMI1/KNR4 family protein [Virgibacillus sp. 179-BFC.A HS]|uniref:SMI1/KNR4 family protein n=1 Tax=Tigheibacillus jepli TaxID=3035914 RepID=A0ABU5CKC9_9BACI|nr:SMI1/KNR4 family protein [Virgibacillus sp. 179-BFC.A HS]MDY0406302.1 SMI1/KNR4 family protein [Virgibacillus sp. 179-BFC.A HS]
MKHLKRKLEGIIDFDIKDEENQWDENKIATFEKKFDLALPDDYAFYLQHYGNDYIRENYRFVPPIDLPEVINQNEFEIDSIFGLYNDENNIENKISFYADILPNELFPIADLPGGDLICMAKRKPTKNNVYIWFHEMSGKNTFLVSDSFQSFINSFAKTKIEENNLNDVKLNFGSKLDKFLSDASEKG